THRRLGAFLHFAALGLAALGLDASWYVPSVPPAIGVSDRTPCSEMSVGRLAGFLGFRFQVVQASCFLLLFALLRKGDGRTYAWHVSQSGFHRTFLNTFSV